MRQFLVLLALLFASAACAQKVKTSEGEYTYHVPDNVTPEQARRTALDRAKEDAIERAFGSVVSQYNTTRTVNMDGQSSVDFTSIGGSELKGVWLETIGKPQYVERYEEGMWIVSCTVKGKVCEMVSAPIDLQPRVLRNGVEDKYESDRFKSGDDLYLSFCSPINGYLAVYLVNDAREAFCLLPYEKQQTDFYPIEANRRYVFFHEQSAPIEERSVVDEWQMSCERSSEYDQLFVIFSPNAFYKAVEGQSNEKRPPQLSFEDFNKWLVKLRKHDEKMNVRLIPIMIEK